MTPQRSLVALALATACAYSASCSKDSCLVDDSGPECAEPPVAPDDPTVSPGTYTVVQQRFSIKGDTIKVTMNGRTNVADPVLITQGEGVALALGAVGAGEVELPASRLRDARFKPGPAWLLIGASAPVLVRLYLPPVYMEPSVSVPTGAGGPIWVGIGNGQTLVSLNDVGGLPPSVNFVEYSYATQAATWTGPKAYTPKSRASMTLSKRYIGYQMPLKSNVFLSSSQLGADKGDGSPLKTNNTAILDMSVDRMGSLLGSILDNQLVVYVGADLVNPQPMVVPVGEVMSPTILGSGDLDGDKLSDLLVWDDTAKSLRLLRQSQSMRTTSFALDSATSTQLQTALASDVPTALFIEDIDGDDLNDVIYLAGKQIGWLVNQGAMSDGSVLFKKADGLSPSSASLDSFSVGDVDMDGKTDLVIASKAGKSLSVYINHATY